jgi:hypothetical protein
MKKNKMALKHENEVKRLKLQIKFRDFEIENLKYQVEKKEKWFQIKTDHLELQLKQQQDSYEKYVEEVNLMLNDLMEVETNSVPDSM